MKQDLKLDLLQKDCGIKMESMERLLDETGQSITILSAILSKLKRNL